MESREKTSSIIGLELNEELDSRQTIRICLPEVDLENPQKFANRSRCTLDCAFTVMPYGYVAAPENALLRMRTSVPKGTLRPWP